MNQIFLGVFNLYNKTFVLVVAVLAGLAQFWQAKTSGSFGNAPAPGSKNDFAGLMQKQILYVFPIITLIFIYRLGGVIGIYWLFSTLFSVGEQYLVNRKFRGGADLPRTGPKSLGGLPLPKIYGQKN